MFSKYSITIFRDGNIERHSLVDWWSLLFNTIILTWYNSLIILGGISWSIKPERKRLGILVDLILTTLTNYINKNLCIIHRTNTCMYSCTYKHTQACTHLHTHTHTHTHMHAHTHNTHVCAYTQARIHTDSVIPTWFLKQNKGKYCAPGNICCAMAGILVNVFSTTSAIILHEYNIDWVHNEPF